MFAEALAFYEKHPPTDESPWYWWALADVYGRSGRNAQAQHALERLLELNRRRPVHVDALVEAYLGLGHKSQPLAELEKASLQQPNALVSLKVDPLFDPLRGDPRFQEFMRRVGLAQ